MSFSQTGFLGGVALNQASEGSEIFLWEGHLPTHPPSGSLSGNCCSFLLQEGGGQEGTHGLARGRLTMANVY